MGEPAPPWFVLWDGSSSVVLRLHEELLDFAAFACPTVEERIARSRWVAEIEAAVSSLWEGCTVHMFGSSSTGLCLPCADVDIAVNGLEGVRTTTAMKRLAERLLELGQISRLQIVQSAKVPVMKLRQRSTGLWADVLVNRTDGLNTTRFVRRQVKTFPALVPLVLFLKLFLSQNRSMHCVKLSELPVTARRVGTMM